MKLSGEKGFSLLEILLAVGIFAVAATSLFMIVVNSKGKIVDNDRLLQGLILANNKMIEITDEIEEDISRGKFPDVVKKEGKFDENDVYAWEYEIKKVELPENLLQEQEGIPAVVAAAFSQELREISKKVRALTLTVRWGEGGNKGDEGDEKEDSDNETVKLTTHFVDLE